MLLKNNSASCSTCDEKKGLRSFFAVGQEDCCIKGSTLARHAERHHGRIEREERPSKRRRNNTDVTQRKLKKTTICDAAKKAIWNQNIRMLSSGETSF